MGPLVDGADPVWPALSVAVASKDQVPRLVTSLAAEKVDFIKLYVGLSDQLVRTISAEARKSNIRTIIDQWENLDRAIQMGLAARSRVELEFSIQAVARRHLVLFRELVTSD